MIAAAIVLAAAHVTVPPTGLWQNPSRTLTVQTRMCGALLCGTIVAAAPRATTDARDAGVSPLVGMSLLRDYHPTGADRWEGRVYVPNQDRSFFSRIVTTTPDTLRISGCILGGLLCRSQVWSRP